MEEDTCFSLGGCLLIVTFWAALSLHKGLQIYATSYCPRLSLAVWERDGVFLDIMTSHGRTRETSRGGLIQKSYEEQEAQNAVKENKQVHENKVYLFWYVCIGWKQRWSVSHGKEENIFIASALVFQDCHNKIPDAGWLKQQKFIFSSFWSLEVEVQGVSCLVFPKAALFGWWMLTYLPCLQRSFLRVLAPLVYLLLVRTPVLLGVPHLNFMTSFKLHLLLTGPLQI